MSTTTQQQSELLREAQATIEEQQALLEQLTAPVYGLAHVVNVLPDSTVVFHDNHLLELDRKGSATYAAGDTVKLNVKTKQIHARSEHQAYGEQAVFFRQREVNYADVYECRTADGRVLHAIHSRVALSEGDRVILDASGKVILGNLPRDENTVNTSSIQLRWDKIGGLKEAKAELRTALELPVRHSNLFNSFGSKQPKGFLFWGRPGNGKTLLGKAAATCLAELYGKSMANEGFIYIKGPEILSKWVGETEETIRRRFQDARLFKRNHGYPAVMFIDEADAILASRNLKTAGGMEHTVVPQFLSEMDGLEDSSTIVILATNRADMLDPAVVRPGRIDRKIYVGPPDQAAAKEILKIHLRTLPCNGKREDLVNYAAAKFFSDEFPLYKVRTPDKEIPFCLHHLVSGALVAGIVEQATSVALQRNIAENNYSADGFRTSDFDVAITKMYREQNGMNHSLELQEFIENNKLNVISAERMMVA